MTFSADIARDARPRRTRRQTITCLAGLSLGLFPGLAPADSPQTVHLAAGFRISDEGEVLRLPPIPGGPERVVIHAMTADPSGRFIAVAGDDLAIRLIDVAGMRLVRTIRPEGEHHHRDTIRSLAFDRSGRRMVSTGNDGRIVIYDAASSFEAVQSTGGAPALACIRFSPDGRQMAAVGFDSEVFLIGKTNGRAKLRCGCRDLRGIAYSDDGRLLAVGGRVGDVHLFSTSPPEEIGDFPLHKGRIRALAFRRDSATLVTVGEDGALVVFDTDKREILSRVTVANCHLYCAAMLDSRLVATGGSDNRIHLIDSDAGKVIGHLPGHQGTIADVVSSGDWLYSGSYDATVRRWSLRSLENLAPQLAGNEQRIAEGQPTLDR